MIMTVSALRTADEYKGRADDKLEEAWLQVNCITETCNTMWYPSTCAAMGLADVRAGTQMIVPPPPL